jgi:hypothetical protein
MFAGARGVLCVEDDMHRKSLLEGPLDTLYDKIDFLQKQALRSFDDRERELRSCSFTG